MSTPEEEFAKPAGLSKLGELAFDVIDAWRKKRGLNYTGGCRTYYSPAEWKARGEQYGLGSELVIVHDGGDLSSYCDNHTGLWADKELIAEMEKIGLYIEACTGWFDAVYKLWREADYK